MAVYMSLSRRDVDLYREGRVRMEAIEPQVVAAGWTYAGGWSALGKVDSFGKSRIWT